MRAILVILLALAGCASDSDVAADLSVADMTLVGEFCGHGSRCCTNEKLGQPCMTGDSCRYNVLCPPGYFICVSGVWVHDGPDSCDMAMSFGD
jgi:hypothetical protein